MVRFSIPAAHVAIEVDTQPLLLSIFEHARGLLLSGISDLFGANPVVWGAVGATVLFFAVWSLVVGIAVLRDLAGRAARLYLSQLWRAVAAFLALAVLAAAAYEPRWIKLFLAWSTFGLPLVALAVRELVKEWLWENVVSLLPVSHAVQVPLFGFLIYAAYRVLRWVFTR